MRPAEYSMWPETEFAYCTNNNDMTVYRLFFESVKCMPTDWITGKEFNFSPMPRWALGPTQPRIMWLGLFPRRIVVAARNWPLISFQCRNAWSLTSIHKSLQLIILLINVYILMCSKQNIQITKMKNDKCTSWITLSLHVSKRVLCDF